MQPSAPPVVPPVSEAHASWSWIRKSITAAAQGETETSGGNTTHGDSRDSAGIAWRARAPCEASRRGRGRGATHSRDR
eukprot:6026739-Prymnesium_polylepis.1